MSAPRRRPTVGGERRHRMDPTLFMIIVLVLIISCVGISVAAH